MNNPYRARPGRPRADHATVTNYGMQNQNSWGAMTGAAQPGIPAATGFQGQQQPQQHPIAGQPKQTGDPWDWGSENVDNGNDSWNWSVDQQSDPQQIPPQQPQLQQQQQQFGYPNNMQTPPHPPQESYYKNANGNNRPAPLNPVHPDGSGRNTPRTAPSRETTPHQSENYSNYTNYSTNQQHPVPPRQNPIKAASVPPGEHARWSANSQPQQLEPPAVIDHTDRQAPPFNPYFQTNPPSFDSKGPTTPQQPPVANSYSWNSVDRPNVPVQGQNWQNHTEVGSNAGWNDYWQDNANAEADGQYENPDNQWQAHAQTPQGFPAVATSAPTDQWQNQNQSIETEQLGQRPQIPLNHHAGATQTSWNRSKSSNASQPWQQVPPRAEGPPGPWPIQQQSVEAANNPPDGTVEDELASGRISSKEWSQVKPPLAHFASSTASTTSGSIPNLSSSADAADERKKSLATSVASSTSLNDSPTEGKATMLYQAPGVGDRGNWAASETNSISDNSENVLIQDSVEVDWNADSDWGSRPIAELSSSVSQLVIGSSESSQPQQREVHVAPPSYANLRQITPDETVSSLVSSSPPRNPVENPRVESHAETTVDPYQPNTGSLPEGVTPTNYDQWYNQSVSQPPQSSNWYANDRPRPTQQWTTEENIENYENIQQPAEFVNLEVVDPVVQERDIYGSRDSINKETLENDPKPRLSPPKDIIANARDSRQEASNVEVPAVQQIQQIQIVAQTDQAPDNYEFASNDRNTFLETGELTDSHQEHESAPTSQDDENDEVPSDIPFLREVPGQSSSSSDPRRNDPTGQEQYVQSNSRVAPDPRRNEPSGQAQSVAARNLNERVERRDVPPGQERSSLATLSRGENETLERRNDPSGRERSLPPGQSRNDPSGEERAQSQRSILLEPTEIRQVPGSGTNSEENLPPVDGAPRQIPGGASPNEAALLLNDDRNNTRVVTGSQQVGTAVLAATMQDPANESRNKREEAVGASVGETPSVTGPPNNRDSYEDGDDEGSGNSRDESRERRRDGSPTAERRRYDREREYDDDYYYDRRRGADYDRAYNSREDLDRRDATYREGDRRHASRDDLDRHARDDPERRGRSKEDLDERDGRRRIEERRGNRNEDPRRRDREGREFDPRYPRDREYPDRERRRDDRRPRRYDDYDPRDPPSRREYYEDPYARSSRPSSRSSYNDRERDYYMRARDPYYGYGAGYNGYDYGTTYNRDYYAYLENLRRTNPAAYSEWYHKYYTNQHQQQVPRGVTNYQEDRASVHSGRSSCEDRLFANPSFCFHAPNKSLYVSYFGYPGCINSPLRRRRSSFRNLDRTTTSEKRTLGDLSVLEDSRLASSRLTPTKFSTSHVIGSLSIGTLLHVHACYPADGERAKVDILRLDYHLTHDPVARELRAYPGPLIKQVGVTHKKTIIEYCESKIKKAAVNEELPDRASYILLYELMIMLIQQNGNVVGVDIAQLLLGNKDAYPYNANKAIHEPVRRESTISQRSGGTGGDGSIHDGITPQESAETPKPRKTVEQMTDEFRNTLLYGLVQEALEYAMNEGLWGHALFLASKLDKRTHATVMTRFANSLPVQDPLQTLYQLHSGRVPAAVTCVSDPKWDDWRPHLAMIISNTSANPEINRRSITNLGDTLVARGDIHAAHFCYILAQIDFGPYGAPGVKVVLIGSNHQKPYAEFVTPEAIMLTEIYEYARHLSEPGFTLVDLQTFKFESARKMVDYGLMEKALLYLEQIAVNVINDPAKYKASFINEIYTLGDRIKFHDPVCKDSVDDAASLVWLTNLAAIVDRCQTGEIVQDVYATQHAADLQNAATAETQAIRGPSQSVPWKDPYWVEHPEGPVDQEIQESQQGATNAWREQQDYTHRPEGPTSLMEVPSTDPQTDWQPLSLPTNSADHGALYPGANVDSSQYQQNPQQQQDYWSRTNYTQQEYQTQDYTSGDWQQRSNASQYPAEQTDVDSTQQQTGTWNYDPQPTISMGPSSGKQYDPLEELDALEPPRDGAKAASNNKKVSEKSMEKKNPNASGSWFGGLFSKLTLKPQNQMILPDDSNPTIVWDPVAKKWTNKNEDGDSGGSTSLVAPPPKAADMGLGPPIVQLQAAPQQAPQLDPSPEQAVGVNTPKLPTGSNMFKLQKGRNMRAYYSDVTNPGGTKGNGMSTNIPTPATSPLVPMATSSPQVFIPTPVNDPAAPVDFLTAAAPVQVAPSENANQGLSRWSSTSSLSREVQSYTMRDPRLLQRTKGPMMYNPTSVTDRSGKNAPRSRYPPR